MAFNTSGGVPVSLTVLGGLVTEMSPVALPEGVSPSNAELMFLPGSAYSRPGFQRVFNVPFPESGPSSQIPGVVYGKSFVTPTGAIQNLYLDSNGVVWMENWSVAPGSYTQILQVTPGSYCKSITAFGREWMAFSDGLNPTDIAYFWDGTEIGRVTQDGPGAPPVCQSIAFPGIDLNTSSGGSATVTGAATVLPTRFAQPRVGFYYAAVQITLATGLPLNVGNSVTISGAGNAFFDGIWPVSTIVAGVAGSSVTSFYSNGYFPTLETDSSGTATSVSGQTLTRHNNIVTGATTSPHNLQVGYQVQINGTTASAIGGGITRIVIDNESLSGEATVTTAIAHGLGPNQDITITGVQPVSVGGGLVSALRSGQSVTLTFTAEHGLVPGAVIVVAGVTSSGSTNFNGSFTVATIPSPTTVQYDQFADDDTGTSGTASVSWPVPDDTPTPTYFTVLSCPTAVTFTIQVTFSDGTWTSGAIGFGWDGIFYVTNIIDAFDFQYQQYGPDVTTTSSGTATPYGQCTPGLHLFQVLWETDQGYIPAPSPPGQFIANGGQYISITGIPTGPSNVKSRIIAFTGAQPNVPGELPPFFYIPVPAQLEGQTVSTATQIYDNSTTSATLDFADNTLFAAIGISITGNQPVNQIVLDGALGFAYFDSRLTTWGQRNSIQNLLAMNFGGGFGFNGVSQIYPLGWTRPVNTVNATFVQSNWEGLWQVNASQGDAVGTSGNLFQGAYEDAYGNPVLEPNTLYGIQFMVSAINAATGVLNDLTWRFYISSASTGFMATAQINGNALSSWGAQNFQYLTVNFSQKTPVTIPNDMIFGFYAICTSGNINFTISRLTLFDAQQPYLDNDAFTSYVDNPLAFDGDSGNGQPENDTRKIMDFFYLRNTPYCITQDPSGKLHEIIENPTSEPSGWSWKEVAAACGTLSAFGTAHSQADDETASAGDDWTVWPSEDGGTIFDGTQPKKISQEIQPNWYAPYSSYPWAEPGIGINMAAATTIQVLNDPVEKMIFWFLPSGTATAPNIIYPLSYRELNGSYAIANSPPFHPSLSGRLIATDNTRKWTQWLRPMNGAARMYRISPSQLTTVFFGGNGQVAGTAAAFGNVYTLNPSFAVDDDYGAYFPYYITSFFIDPEKAQALGLNTVRILCCYANIFISQSDIFNQYTATFNMLVDSLTNAWPINVQRPLSTNPTFDVEFAGNQAIGNRMALRVAATQFNLQKVQLWFKAAKLKIGGRAQ
jgi:hypothetical protein